MPLWHNKDKFFQTEKEVKMGSWGITMRQSDYGLDLLGTIVDTQLKAANFATFNVAEAIDVLRQDILEEIKRANRDCPRRSWTTISIPISRRTSPRQRSWSWSV